MDTVEVQCYQCSNTIVGDRFIVDGHTLCSRCNERETSLCYSCDERFLSDTLTRIYNDEYVCDDCRENNFCFCEPCGEWVHCDDYVGTGDRCSSCAEDDFRDEEDIGNGMPNMQINSHQSTALGEIIKSKRRFGVELETVYSSGDGARALVNECVDGKLKGFGLVHDGSIDVHRGNAGGTEIVSNILRGLSGELAIRNLEKLARTNGFSVNRSCGFHVHLEATDYKRIPQEDKEGTSYGKRPVTYYKYVFDGKETELREPAYDPYSGELVQPISTRVVLEPSPKIKYNQGVSYARLRKLFSLYACFDDVFRAMQPKTRRANSFCLPVSNTYTVRDILDCSDYIALEKLWYRNKDEREIDSRKQGGKYDGSRYCGVNLHALFHDKGKTIEIRYHTPTLNAEKILRWVSIHQTILDACADPRGNVDVMRAVAEETNILKKAETLGKLVKLNEEDTKYMLSRIRKFMTEAEDAEVEKGEEVSEAVTAVRYEAI